MFKIRCSSIADIMTKPRSKSEELSKTTITYLQNWYKEQLYNRKKEFHSKYCDKGNAMESHSIELISEHYDLGLLFKNEKHFENDFITGTPDVILKDNLIDIKNSWDCFTFPLFDEELDKRYFYQVQGYMALTGFKNASVIYTLMDMPGDLLERQIFYEQRRLGIDELTEEVENEIIAHHTYSNFDPKLRIKKYDVERDDEVINDIYIQVEKCRNYLKTIKL